MPIHFNAFTQCAVGLQSFGQWRNPADRTSHGYKDLTFWLDLVQTLERGCFDSLFLRTSTAWMTSISTAPMLVVAMPYNFLAMIPPCYFLHLPRRLGIWASS